MAVGDAGLSAAGADVEHGLRVFEIGQEGQAVEQVVADGLGGIAQGGQVVGFCSTFAAGRHSLAVWPVWLRRCPNPVPVCRRGAVAPDSFVIPYWLKRVGCNGNGKHAV